MTKTLICIQPLLVRCAHTRAGRPYACVDGTIIGGLRAGQSTKLMAFDAAYETTIAATNSGNPVAFYALVEPGHAPRIIEPVANA